MLDILKHLYHIVDLTPAQEIERIKTLMGIPLSGYTSESNPAEITIGRERLLDNKQFLIQALDKDLSKEGMNDEARKELEKILDLIKRMK